MNEPILKPTGKGRHGKRATPDIRHSEETKRAAIQMFVAGKRPMHIAKELGVKFQTAYSWFAKYRNELANTCVVPSEADPGDEA